jgi:hypothetical protein
MTFARLEDISDRLDRIALRRPIASNPIDAFQVSFNDTTKGATVSFKLVDNQGLATIVLKRNFSLDLGSANIVNTWEAQTIDEGATVSFEDTNQDIRNNTGTSYWLECHPRIDDFAAVTIGPQTLSLTLDQLPPDPISSFDASHEAVSGGTVLIGIAFKAKTGDPRFGSCRIYIAGYNGVAATVEIAQNATSPFRFALLQTGETVTLSAVAVSPNGIESTGSAPTKALTLDAAATVPAKIVNASALELSTGVQITFAAGPESNVTLYQVYRGPRGLGFGSASSIGTVTPTGSSAYTFLDSGGLAGQYEWFVFAVNAIGNGTASDQILPPPSSLTSADQPINAPANATNQATVDSIDAGADATIRIYGSGGVGSSWTRPAGFGNQTFPAGSILHKSYTTKYYVVYDTLNLQYLAFTSQLSALPDNYAWAGSVTTVAAGGGGGTPGGGGAGGGGDGTCPEVETWLTPNIRALDVKSGDLLDCYEDDRVVQYPVLSVEFAEAECFLVCAGRAAKVVAWNTPFVLPDKTALRCYEMEGQVVFTDDGWLRCKIFAVGKRRVAKVNLGGKVFAGGVTRRGCRIFSHNIVPDK